MVVALTLVVVVVIVVVIVIHTPLALKVLDNPTGPASGTDRVKKGVVICAFLLFFILHFVFPLYPKAALICATEATGIEATQASHRTFSPLLV